VGKETLTVTHKIRLFPNNESEMFALLSLHRRAYNLAIEHFKTTSYKDQKKVIELRRDIKAQCKTEWEGRLYYAEVAGEAVRVAFTTKQSIIRKRKQGKKCDYSFKSIKESKQYFVAQRLNRKLMSMFHVTEDLPKDALGRTTNICFEFGRWFVCALGGIEVKKGAENQGLSIASIDPGVRTFATIYSNKEAYKLGDNFYRDKIFPLLVQVDKLLSNRALYLNKSPNRSTQSFRDSMRYFSKKINNLRNRVDDLISDLHRRSAHFLVTNFDVILLPAFKTQEMSKKVGRKIRTKTVRSMLGLKHYQFQQTMKWMCKKYGKTLQIVNEAYTSKTMSWSGEIKNNLGGAKTISDGTVKVDRDINGARGIMLRALSVASTDNRCINCD